MLQGLLAERPVIGTFLKLPRPEVVSILALAGYDFLICDLEHSQIDERECREVLLAARADGLAVVVRVADLDRGLINRLLEAGAAGIQLPRLRTASDADALRDLMRYPPAGSRSVSQAQPAARYGAEPLLDYLQRANRSGMVIGQFETADLVNPLDDVVARLDVAFIGSLDLSVDAGHPGEVDAPAVRQYRSVVEDAAKRAATPLGMFAATAEAARTAMDAGYRYLAVGADVSMLRRGATEILDAVTAAGTAQSRS